MASRASLIQSRSIYVGTLNSVAPSDGNLIVTGNVGIGTTAPGAKLNIVHTASTTIPALQVASSASLASNDIVRFQINGLTNGFRMFQDASSVLNYTFQDGNVGIGTTSPTTKLHVTGVTHIAESGNSAFYGGNYVRVFNDQNFNIRNVSGTTVANISVSGNSYFNGGNVGIGTTNPAEKLDVDGNVKVGTRLAMTPSVFGYNSAWKTLIFGSAGTDYTTNATTITFGVDLSANPSGSYTGNGGEIFFRNIVSFGTPNAANDGYLYPMAFNNGQVHFTAGNVGIGTVSPISKLEISGPTGSYSSGIGFSATGTGARTYRTYIGTNGYFYFDDATGGSSRLTIDTSGNVGIGTTSPAYKLDVAGTGRFISDTAANGAPSAGYFYSGDDSSNMWRGAVSIQHNSNTTIVAGSSIGIVLSPLASTGSTFYGHASIKAVRPNATANNQNTDLSFWTRAGASNSTTDTEKMRITSAGNVGIGTTSPLAILDVYQAGQPQLRVRGTTGANHLYQDSTTGTTINDGLFVGIGGDQTGYIYHYEANPLVFATSNAERMRITAGGNVGIGTTSPGEKLVVSNGGAAGFEWVPLTGRWYRYNRSTAAYAGIYTEASEHTWSIGASEAMRLNASGNVGIGTTAPTVPLHIVKDNATISMTNTTAFAVDTGSRLFLGGKYSSGTSNNTTPFAWIVGAKENATDGNQAGYLSITTVANGGGFAERMRVTSAGNVGIGTTNPLYPLDVQSGGVGTVFRAGTSFISIDPTGSASAPSLIFNGDDNTGIWRPAADTLAFSTAGAERMRITDAGNVGIGTTTANTLLSIDGVADNGISIQGISTTATRAFFGLDANGDGYMSLTNGGTFVKNVQLTSDLGVNNYILGNVGIGTTAPNRKLHVESSGVIADFKSTTTQGLVDIIGTSNQLRIGTFSGVVGLAYGTGTSPHITIVSGGNVGIGTTSPTNRLQVQPALISFDLNGLSNGAIALTNNSNASIAPTIGGKSTTSGQPGLQFITGTNDTNTGADMIFSVRESDNTDFLTLTSSAYKFLRYTTSLLEILRNGNVGIGTTAPAFKLEVNAGSNAGMWLQGSSDVRYHAFSSSSNDWVGYELRSSNVNSFAGGMFRNNGANNRVSLYNKNSEAISLMDTGNVGIGTTAPTNRLTVTTATNAVDVLRLNNTGGDSGAVQGVTHLAINHFNGGTNPSTRITAYQDSTSGWPGGMYFSTRSLNTDSAPLERMRITSAGNVGIGTTSPQYLLDVNGDAQINAEGFGPDYVYVPDGEFGLDSLITSGSENVALGKPDVWLRIHVDGAAFVFPGYQEP